MIADLVVRGSIATLPRSGGPETGLGLANGIAIAAGRVIAAGPWETIADLAGPGTRYLRLAPDEVAIPGLTDAHLHLADAALATVRLDLAAATTVGDGLERVGAAHRALDDPAAWLRGGGWDVRAWGRWPTADELGRVAPGRPVLLWSHDLHAVWVSPAALAIAGLDATTPDPPGGRLRRLADGSPEGVLHEDATGLVTRFAPRETGDRLAELIERMAHRLLTLGLVAIHDPGELEMDRTLSEGFAAIEQLATLGTLPIRVHAGLRSGALDVAIARGLRSGAPLGPASGRARVGWLKLFADGTLGSRTAALLAPYAAEPDRGAPPGGPAGLLVTDPAELRDLAGRAAAAGIATQIHAIGDRAVRAALDALEPTAERLRLRPRIEHVQLVHPADLPRFARAGIVASVQPGDLRDDAAGARRSWGTRPSFAYPWGRLLASGATLAFGTDAPTADPSPWPGLAAAVTRRDPSWDAAVPTFGPDERLTIVDALHAACSGAALAAGEPDRGTLGPGARADLVVIPRQALEDADVLREVRPRLVFLDGVLAHER